MSITNHIRIDEGHDKDEEKTISECVKNFLGLDCELPWDAKRAGRSIAFPQSYRPMMYLTFVCLKGTSDNVCNSTDDTKRYYDLMRELQWDMTLSKFREKTKCLLKSNFSQVRMIRDDPDRLQCIKMIPVPIGGERSKVGEFLQE